MRKIYLTLFITIIIILWIIYFIQSYKPLFYIENIEGFTPQIHSIYRPYIRNFNQKIETFIHNYGPNVIITKLRKWNIY